MNSKCGVQSKRRCESHASWVCIAGFPACGCQKKSVVYETECRHVSPFLRIHLSPSARICFRHTKSALLFFQSCLTEKRRLCPFLVTVQIHPLSVMVYPKVLFSVPYYFFCTQNHSHKSMTDTRFPIVNLPIVVMQLYSSVPREHLRSLISNMHL